MIAVTGQAASRMSALRRARMVLLSLALMAGILGMHIMSLAPMDSQGAPSAAGDHGAVHILAPAEDPGHMGHPGSSAASDHDHTGSQQPAPQLDETCSGDHGSAGMHSMDPSCTPAAKSASLEAPLPGTGISVVNPPAGEPLQTATMSRRPVGPSPGDLCISRT